MYVLLRVYTCLVLYCCVYVCIYVPYTPACMCVYTCLVLYSCVYVFFVNPFPNSRSLGLETVNYYVYGKDSAVGTADQTVLQYWLKLLILCNVLIQSGSSSGKYNSEQVCIKIVFA